MEKRRNRKNVMYLLIFTVRFLQALQSSIHIISISSQSVLCLLYGKSAIYDLLHAVIQ